MLFSLIKDIMPSRKIRSLFPCSHSWMQVFLSSMLPTSFFLLRNVGLKIQNLMNDWSFNIEFLYLQCRGLPW